MNTLAVICILFTRDNTFFCTCRFRSPDVEGDVGKGAGGVIRFGPAFIYDQTHDTLKYISVTFSSRVEDDLERYRQILNGEASADAEGIDVFRRLKELVMD